MSGADGMRLTGQISWVYADEPGPARRFYADILGLEMVRDEGTAQIFQTGEGAFIGLCQAFEDRVVQPAGGMITLVTDDVDGWYALLKATSRKLPVSW